ncbi:hypothetical protein EUTSA_v10019599mg, partial [Eutrema salsugineum]
NGTLVSTGGFEGGANTAKYLVNCKTCVWKEYPKALATRRWYSTQATLLAGTFIVVGGRDALNYEYILPEEMNNKKLNNSQLLRQIDDLEKKNLYPFVWLNTDRKQSILFVWLNTDGDLFVFANNRSILRSPKTNKVIKEFPQLPGGAHNYLGSASSALLPIRLYVNNPAVIPADVIICGGAKHDGFYRADRKKTFDPALKDCARMSINSAKPFRAWNCAKDPNLSPLLYMPNKTLSKRFKELAPSTIPRMYHSIAIALPDGKVLVGGSNTNDGYKYDVEFPTEVRLDKFSLPYLDPALDFDLFSVHGTPKNARHIHNATASKTIVGFVVPREYCLFQATNCCGTLLKSG